MVISFTEWLKKMDEAKEIESGWSKNIKVPLGSKKDVQPDHPTNAVDPEKKLTKKKRNQ